MLYIDICVKAVHIAARNNPVADLPSRWFTIPNNVQKLQQLLHPVTWTHTAQDLLLTDNENLRSTVC